MKRTLSISFIFAAISLMLSVSFVPHHHHGAIACTQTHRCTDCDCGKTHSSDGQTGDEGDKHDGCVADAVYAARYERESEQTECAAPECEIEGHIHPFVVLCLYKTTPVDDDVHIDTGKYINHYRSADIHPCAGLRAPPATLC